MGAIEAEWLIIKILFKVMIWGPHEAVKIPDVETIIYPESLKHAKAGNIIK